MKKRGQFTVFVVLGVVVIILAGFVYYNQVALTKRGVSASVKKAGKVSFDVTPIKKYAENCLKEVSESGLWLVGAQGGYVDLEGIDSTTYLGYGVPYYLDAITEHYLQLGDIEGKLLDYVIVEFEKCFDLTAFEDDGYDITKLDGGDSNVSINIDSVVIEVGYPLTIRKNDVETRLSDFRVNLPIRLGRLYNASVNGSSGLLKEIRNAWNNWPIGVYDLSNFNCDDYDPVLKQINIYSKDNDDGDGHTKIIRFVDYNPFYYKYLRAYIFQVAIKGNDPIEFTGNMCMGEEVVP